MNGENSILASWFTKDCPESLQVLARVTSLGGRLLLADFLKITKIAQIFGLPFSTVQVMYLFCQKWATYIFVIFSQTPLGSML
jgi:hypothetical protein